MNASVERIAISLEIFAKIGTFTRVFNVKYLIMDRFVSIWTA